MIGHDFCRVLVKLIDQELKQAEIIVPFEDLFVNERNDEDEKQFVRSRNITFCGKDFFLERKQRKTNAETYLRILHHRQTHWTLVPSHRLTVLILVERRN